MFIHNKIYIKYSVSSNEYTYPYSQNLAYICKKKNVLILHELSIVDRPIRVRRLRLVCLYIK